MIKIACITSLFVLFVCMIFFGLWCWFYANTSLFPHRYWRTDIIGLIAQAIGLTGLSITAFIWGKGEQDNED